MGTTIVYVQYSQNMLIDLLTTGYIINVTIALLFQPNATAERGRGRPRGPSKSTLARARKSATMKKVHSRERTRALHRECVEMGKDLVSERSAMDD